LDRRSPYRGTVIAPARPDYVVMELAQDPRALATVRGICRRSRDGEPALGVRVELTPLAFAGGAQVRMTESDGLFRFDSLPPGPFTLRAAGAAGTRESAFVLSREGRTADLVLSDR
jgi:hypothetical protein